jgi:hypothetical protein
VDIEADSADVAKSEQVPVIESIPKFLVWFDEVEEAFESQSDDVYNKFYSQLETQTKQCDVLLNEVSSR